MARKVRLLFVLNEQLGWKTYSQQLKKALVARDDVEWEVCHPAANRWLRSPLKRHNLRRYDRWFRRLDPITAYESYLGRSVRAAVDRFKPDFVHFAAHQPAAALNRSGSAPPFTAALDATRRNMDGFRDYRVWTDAEYDREARLMRQAVLLFPFSGWAGRSLSADYGVPEDRVDIMPPSVDGRLIGVRDPAARGPGLPRILFIGNDFRRKGGHLLVDWVRGPLAGLCELHIVSRDPAVAGLGGPGVVVHGGVSHGELVARLLPQMDILCHPTQSDMSAYVVAEASFAGIPSVASTVGGIPELMVEGESGWCLDRTDEDGFVTRLRALIADPELVSRAGERARAFAWQNNDATANYGRLVDRLKDLAGTAR